MLETALNLDRAAMHGFHETTSVGVRDVQLSLYVCLCMYGMYIL